MEGASNVCIEPAVFRRKTGHKNGKEAIFEALCRVPAFASIAGVAAPSTSLRGQPLRQRVPRPSNRG